MRWSLFLFAAALPLSGSLAGQAKLLDSSTSRLLDFPQAAPVSTFGYDRSAPLQLRDSVLRVEDGVTIRSISFASPGGDRATGLLFVPAGSGPFAGVLVQHGAPGRVDSTIIPMLERNVMPNAMALAKAGAVAISVMAPWARKVASPVTFTAADSGYQVQLIQDLQRAVDVLVGRRDVDPNRLGYVGRSYGGATGALFAGIERRLKTYVLQVGDGGLVSHFTGPDGKGGPPPGMPTERWERWIAAMSPIEPIRFVGRAAPASVLLQSGREDKAVPPEIARPLHEATSEPKKVIWYQAGHGLNDSAVRDMLIWFHEHLGTRAP